MSRRAGFTLIELLAVLLLTTIVLTIAVDFYLDLSSATTQAAERTRGTRRAAAVLDRVAHDLESAVLVKRPEGRDPLQHPWLFYAEEGRSGEGADRLKFVTRGHRPRASDVPASDLEMVAYALRPTAGEDAELVRWTAPRLPEALEREVPVRQEEGALLLVEGVTRFGVRFLDESGQWHESWDSTALTHSNQLPLAAEIELALHAAPGALERPGAPEPAVHVRRVIVPVRPLDLEELLGEQAAAGEEDEDEEDEEDGDEETASENEDCVKVAACVNLGAITDPGTAAVVQDFADQCFDSFVSQAASIESAFPGAITCP